MSGMKSGYSRREFLKVVGAGSGLAATGCGKDLPEKLIPYVVQPDEVVPGVASWYSGSCGECAAGCGVVVRVRDGRATKSEGNPNHPVNKGSLCALGQSSIQAHYDPDRVRQPLVRDLAGSFKATPWKDAVEKVGAALKGAASGKEVVLLTAPLSGSIRPLIAEFGKKFSSFSHIQYELLSKDVNDEAAAKVFGNGVTTHFDFSKADVILSVGADYLETWLSPVEFSRQWSEGRKPAAAENGKAKMSYTVHIEPRLSPTAGVQDKWIMNRPGSEAYLLSVILKLVLDKKVGQLPQGTATKLRTDLSAVSLEKVEENTGVTALAITSLVERLLESEKSLVVAGGAACGGEFAVECAELANYINAALGNIGRSVLLRDTAKDQKPAYIALKELGEAVLAGSKKLGVLLVSDTNPVFTLPPEHPFRKALSKAELIVAISSQLDETASFSQVVLPLSTNFESWTDSQPAPGVYNLNQPAMSPLYETQSLGDTLLSLGLKIDFAIEGVKSFEEFIKKEWKARTGEQGFAERFDSYIEKGGDFSKSKISDSKAASFRTEISLNFQKIAAPVSEGAKLLAFPTTLSNDGRSANRAWMHEVPYPMTTSVWGSWIEIHPDTAKKYGIGQKDVVKVETPNGVVEAPAYYSKYIHPELVATPFGLGHEAYGRYAAGVGANVSKVLPVGSSAQFLTALKADTVTEDGVTQSKITFNAISKSLGQEELVIFSGNRDEPVQSQMGRGLIRSVPLAKLALHEDGHNDHHPEDHGTKGHHDPLALGPQPAPRQMYEQMDHPLYRWGMTIDLNACTGCSACVVACYAENNIAVVGKQISSQGREMSWIRLERYFDGDEDQPLSGFLPMMCQHCNNAPCEPVCPVYATYHNEEGVNSMVYNRCVGTRYCLNNCSYKVRRFNWFKYEWPEPLTWQLNPDVTVRSVGVMEKCNFCHHRIVEAKNTAKNMGRTVKDGDIQTACQSTCPTGAIRFGNLQEENSVVAKDAMSERGYKVLDQYINTQPAITYFAKVKHSGAVIEHASAKGLKTVSNRGEA